MNRSGSRRQINAVPGMSLLLGIVASGFLVLSGTAAVMSGTTAGTQDASRTPGEPAFDDQAGQPHWQDRMTCPDCGVVVARRLIHSSGEGVDRGVQEITIRMNDGLRHRIVDANAATWHPGDRVMFIQGAEQANEENEENGANATAKGKPWPEP